MDSNVVFRKPREEDGIEVYELVKASPPLDLNSLYYYLIFCTHFRDTSIVAQINGRIVGFISAYIKPGAADTLFIWQVVVGKQARGKKVGRSMIKEIFKRNELKELKYLETTVTPSNKASRSMFEAFAKHVIANVSEEVFFGKDLFGGHGHEEEVLLRIGPFNQG